MTDYEIMMVLAPVEKDKRAEFLGKAIACMLLTCVEISKIDAWGGEATGVSPRHLLNGLLLPVEIQDC